MQLWLNSETSETDIQPGGTKRLICWKMMTEAKAIVTQVCMIVHIYLCFNSLIVFSYILLLRPGVCVCVCVYVRARVCVFGVLFFFFRRISCGLVKTKVIGNCSLPVHLI